MPHILLPRYGMPVSYREGQDNRGGSGSKIVKSRHAAYGDSIVFMVRKMTERRSIKRFLDLAICLCLLPVALPICLAAMIAIRCESAGSPLFVQWRVGQERRVFRLLKLRTMAARSGDLPSHEIDPMQITRVGAFLRRTKLDELPQLINVIGGSMSLVGPRPCLPSQHLLIAERERLGLYAFAPGVTGPAQLVGIDMSDPVLLARTEAGYFHAATPMRDLSLIVRTATGGGRGDAALRNG